MASDIPTLCLNGNVCFGLASGACRLNHDLGRLCLTELREAGSCRMKRCKFQHLISVSENEYRVALNSTQSYRLDAKHVNKALARVLAPKPEKQVASQEVKVATSEPLAPEPVPTEAPEACPVDSDPLASLTLNPEPIGAALTGDLNSDSAKAHTLKVAIEDAIKQLQEAHKVLSAALALSGQR